MSGEFDPSRHKIVAIVADPDDPERGQHLHVTVAEFRQVVREIERAAPAAEFPPEVAALLQLVITRMEEFDQRLSVIEQVKVQLVQGVVS